MEYIEALAIAIVLAFVIRSFIVQAYRIPSGSMLETLQIGDHILVNKMSYNVRIPFTDIVLFYTGEPKFGDVVVFRYPEDPSKDYIKRLIGLPGDTIELRGKALYRNGKLVSEPYVHYEHPEITDRPLIDQFGPITVPENSYFMLGDNRDNSEDSRYWGFVTKDALLGKAWRIYWSWQAGVPASDLAQGTRGKVRWSRLGTLIQ